MRRRFGFLVVLLLVGALTAPASALPSRSVAARQEAGETGETAPGVEWTDITDRTAQTLQLYRFSFEAGASIDGGYVDQTMVVSVVSGSFVFYIPATGSGRVRLHGAQDVETLAPQGCVPLSEDAEEATCMFDDTVLGDPLDDCTTLEDAVDCQVSDAVAILAGPGTVLYLPRPTYCFVCALDDAAGEFEVAVVAGPGEFDWTSEAASATPVAYAYLGSTRGLDGLVEVPSLSPGGCSGKVKGPL